MSLLTATYQGKPADLTYATSRETARRLIKGEQVSIDESFEQW
ncbi:hypothetical protein [uncultured Erythrobacter sp.]|nr:hypothetical protein [uncultured Erythrobacter sp.]